jgi:hypothetical protein
LTSFIDAVDLEYVLGDIQTDRDNLHLDDSPHGDSSTTITLQGQIDADCLSFLRERRAASGIAEHQELGGLQRQPGLGGARRMVDTGKDRRPRATRRGPFKGYGYSQ